ncbi:MAG: 4Fe-4S dicluster domain-containing protein [Nitrospinota bacterium]
MAGDDRQRGRTSRRAFLKGAAAAGAAAVIPLPVAAQTPEPSPPPLPSLPRQKEGESGLLRMQRELARALKKPVEKRRWVMVIDLRKCVGCTACTAGCVAENALPPGVVYRPVLEEEIGAYPNVSRRFTPRPCMQCDNPPCVDVCPVSATKKRPDGIVDIDYDVCIGCRYCITACPYSARTFDFGEYTTDGTPARQPYEKRTSFEYGQRRKRRRGRSPVGNARKCHFCLHRLNAGQLPACVTTCIGGATYFGDANDPATLVRELIGSPRVMRLKEELGTEPRVFYLV